MTICAKKNQIKPLVNLLEIFVGLINESKPKTHAKSHTFSTNLDLDGLIFSRCITGEDLHYKNNRAVSFDHHD